MFNKYSYFYFKETSPIEWSNTICFRQMNADSHCRFLHSYDVKISMGTLSKDFSFNSILLNSRILEWKVSNPMFNEGKLCVANPKDKVLIDWYTENEIKYSTIESMSIEGLVKHFYDSFYSYALRTTKSVAHKGFEAYIKENLFIQAEEHEGNWVAYENGTYHCGKNYLPSLGLSCIAMSKANDSRLHQLHPYGAPYIGISFSSDTLDENNWVVDFGHKTLKLFTLRLKDFLDHKILVNGYRESSVDTFEIIPEELPTELFQTENLVFAHGSTIKSIEHLYNKANSEVSDTEEPINKSCNITFMTQEEYRDAIHNVEG